MISQERIEKIVSEFFKVSFLYNSILCVDEDECLLFQGDKETPAKEFTLEEFTQLGRDLVHPLFKDRFETDLAKDNLIRQYHDNRLVRVEAMMIDPRDGEYHWYRIRIIPIDDGTDHVVFFFNAMPMDNDVKKSEQNRSEIFNKAVIEQLIYNYILVYVIDLSNSMSHLCFSSKGVEYEEYANQFENHLLMMNDLYSNYVSEDFKVPFSRFLDYGYIREQIESGKDRLVLIFRDKKGQAFEMTFAKYPDYAPDYPLVVFSIKELD